MLPINDTADSLNVLPEPESNPPSRDIPSSISDTISPTTNDPPLTVVSTPLLLNFNKCNVRIKHVKNQNK